MSGGGTTGSSYAASPSLLTPEQYTKAYNDAPNMPPAENPYNFGNAYGVYQAGVTADQYARLYNIINGTTAVPSTPSAPPIPLATPTVNPNAYATGSGPETSYSNYQALPPPTNIVNNGQSGTGVSPLLSSLAGGSALSNLANGVPSAPSIPSTAGSISAALQGNAAGSGSSGGSK